MNDHLLTVQQKVRGLLKAKGLRATATRLDVLVALHERHAPMTHDQVMAALRQRRPDKASVWRILSELSDKGLLRRMDLGDRIWRYELLDGCQTLDQNHSHFLCNDCGNVTCLPPLNVEAVPEFLKQAKYEIRIEGTCGECVTE